MSNLTNEERSWYRQQVRAFREAGWPAEEYDIDLRRDAGGLYCSVIDRESHRHNARRGYKP
jgi:hypothetical protein